MASKVTVTLAEQRYAKLLLQYLHNNYSRKINVNDSYLIYAMAAWLHAADKEHPGRLRYNNPFGVLNAKGRLEKYSSITQGIYAAGRRLIKMSKPIYEYRTVYGPYQSHWTEKVNVNTQQALYRGALNALKTGGNSGAGSFLVWMAWTSWSPTNYGWDLGEDASKAENNKLIAWYLRLGSMEQVVTKTKKKTIVIPRPPRDLNAPIVVRNYLDPWAVKAFYEARHPVIPVLPGLD